MSSSQPEIPSTFRSALFLGKCNLLKLGRALKDLSSSPARRHPKRDAAVGFPVLSESTSRLWSGETGAEVKLQAGKVHNLRIALRSLDGVVVPGGAIFSFWAQIGPATRWKGYAQGRELREGCLIPAVGGGLCQLSNALYDAALKAGFEIVERHAHSRVIPGSLAEAGRDATVFWNYIDLRFKSSQPFQIDASMTADHLTVRLNVHQGVPSAARGNPVEESSHLHRMPNSCSSCGVTACFRGIEHQRSHERFGRAAWLVDEFWPEYDRYIQDNRSQEDVFALPLDGKRFRKTNYSWQTEGFRRVKESRWVTFRRSFAVRRLSSQGAERQRAFLAHDDRLARSYASQLTHDVLHVTVMQNLLPFLWLGGHLGGRTFDVLMTRLPLAHLHARLDEASHRHAESPTLGDFRASSLRVEAETQALEQARHIITPHREVAALFGRKAVLLDWVMPSFCQPVQKGPLVVFPASTLGRKGAYELRAAARALDLRVVVLGSDLEGGSFWDGVRVIHRRPSEDWLQGAGVVVAPAYVEHQPRLLLQAMARGVPVVASSACGLGGADGVSTVPVGDVESLTAMIKQNLQEKDHSGDALTAA